MPVNPGAALLTTLSRAARNVASATESSTLTRSRAATRAPSSVLTWLLTSSASALARSSAALCARSRSRSTPHDRSRANRNTRPITPAKAPSGIRSAYLLRVRGIQFVTGCFRPVESNATEQEAYRQRQLSRGAPAAHLPPNEADLQ